MKNILPLLLVLFITACSQSSNEEVVIFEKNELVQQNPADTNDVPSGATEVEASKPLIQITPDDPLQIMVRADGAPGMYLGDDGEVHGFYVDLERMVMNEMGQAYEFVPYDDLGPMIQKVKEGTIHNALATPDLPDYRSLAYMSIPYEVLNYVIFVQSDNIDIQGETKDALIKSLFGKTVGVQTQGQIFHALREYREITLLEYPTTTQALADLNAGKLDAVPDVERIGKYYLKQNNWNIKSVGVPITSYNICTGFSKMLSPEVFGRYNRALQQVIADGRLERLYGSYFGTMEKSSKP